MTPENQVKLALLEEYKKAVRYQDFYDEGCEVLAGLILGAVTYYRKQGLDIPDRERLYRFAEGLESLTSRHIDFAKSVLPPDMQHRKKSPSDATEPAVKAAERQSSGSRLWRDVL